MPFDNSNTVAGLPKNAAYQAGSSDVDVVQIGQSEKGILLPWPSDPVFSWIYYDCTVGVMMDSGIVVHNRLPQVDNQADTLGTCLIDDPNLEKLGDLGVNLKCVDQYTDIVQRMGHTRYWFRLWGQALRVGKKVPIPSMKTVGGVPAIPYDRNPQWAFNRIAPGGNYGGIILWHAVWSLWYTTAEPPRGGNIPAVDAAAHVSDRTKQPDGIQSPLSQPDDNAVRSAPVPPEQQSVNINPNPNNQR